MSLKTYIKDSFYGGMTEDDRITSPNRFLYSENIDIYSKSNLIQLVKKPIKGCYTTTTIYNLIEITDTVTNNTKVIVFSNDAIYHENSDTAVYTNNILNELKYPVFVIDGYLYWVRSQGTTGDFLLDRITVSGALGTSWSSVVLGYKTLATNNNYSHSSVVVLGSIAYISLGKKVNVYNSGVGTVEEFDIFGHEIAGITYSGGYFRVYTETGNLMLWDGTSSSISESINLGIKIERVKQIANQDFIITGFLGGSIGLFVINGFTPQALFKQQLSQQLDGEKKFNFNKAHNNTCIANDRDNLFFIDTTKVLNSLLYNRVAKYGKDIQGLPKAYSYINTNSDIGNRIIDINSMIFSQGYLYVAFYDGTNNGVMKIDINLNQPTSIETEGHIITNVNDMQMGIFNKSKHNLFLKVGDITSTQYIEVYESIDGGNYNLLHTINSQPKNNISRIPLKGDFRDISYKFVLKTSTNTSPKIYYGPLINYEINEN